MHRTRVRPRLTARLPRAGDFQRWTQEENMRRIGITICCLIAVLAVAVKSDQKKQADSLSVRIVPTGFREQGGRSITLWQPSQRFHVIISNTSEESVRLWREWCSWGEQMLSFRVTDENGKVTLVKRVPREYTKNYPDWTTIPPGDHMVFEVSFDPGTWLSAPLPEKGKSRGVKMQAVFEISEDKDTKVHKVWTGKVSSPEQRYTIYR